MSDVFRTLSDRNIFWTDTAGVTHSCEGAGVHPGIRLLWTDCGRDVPANSAHMQEHSEAIDCEKCKAKLNSCAEVSP